MTTDGGLRPLFRKHLPPPAWLWTSLESRGTASGIPDSYWAHSSGTSGFVEYKQTPGAAVNLRPHQISWIHRHSQVGVRCTIAVLTTGKQASLGAGTALYLVHGRAAVALAAGGLSAVPAADLLGRWLGAPRQWDWAGVAEALLHGG